MFQNDIQPIYNEQGKLISVCISAQIWLKHQDQLESILFQGLSEPGDDKPSARPEPMNEWKNFLSFWDFNYPIEKKVVCKGCGNLTEDWTSDSPRKFSLRTANISGLVAFVCLQCQSRVTKKHFKDHILYECSVDTCSV